MISKTNLLIIVLLVTGLVFSVPNLSSANGGDQRIVDGKYMTNLSRAPFTPRAGDKTQMLASFVDLKTNKLVGEDMTAKIRISRLGGGAGKREFVYEQDNVKVAGGILDFSYTFKDTGLHEIFFDFAFASNPERVYNAPDFLIDVQKSETSSKSNLGIFLGTVSGVILGFVIGWVMRKDSKTN